MRLARGALSVLGRATVLVLAPIAAATEPAVVRDHGDRAIVAPSVAVPLEAPAPRAAGFEAGIDVSFRLRDGYPAPDGRPNAWVYIPSRLEPQATEPLDIVVIFHGFKNCIASYISPHGTPCASGRPQRTGYDLPRQSERSGSKALIVVPELAFDTSSSDAGPLAEPDALRRFLTELVEEKLTPYIGARRFQGSRVSFMASSGGYQALEPALAYGNVDVREIVMLDGFYLYEGSAVARFLSEHLDDYRPGAAHPRRFIVIYTPKGGALEMSTLLHEKAQRWLSRAGMLELGRFAEGPPSQADLAAPIVVMEAKLEHDEIVTQYLWRVLAASASAAAAP